MDETVRLIPHPDFEEEEGRDLEIVIRSYCYMVSSAQLRRASYVLTVYHYPPDCQLMPRRPLFRDMLDRQDDPSILHLEEHDPDLAALVLLICTKRTLDLWDHDFDDLIIAIEIANKWRCSVFNEHVFWTLHVASITGLDVGKYALVAAKLRKWELFGDCLASLEGSRAVKDSEDTYVRGILDPRQKTAGEMKELVEIGRDSNDAIDGEVKGFHFVKCLREAGIAALRPDQTLDYAALGANFVRMMEYSENEA